ncbi:N-acetylglucosamine-1-phosphotransferase subunit gamma-like [Dendronephthya gigantea]|uniref:N-acetylglucosamine-1-phosphotransferase subunit gamma-like n=1 Tax=Dendronephthya gigantea TaxID=151771 RepID=UPI0010692365|nr:N-acetylglucosamine-1-phosphotransferase subunit gamma-like [Dendronephthya gigantea]
MNWPLLFLSFCTAWSGVHPAMPAKKPVKIVQEPANYGGLQSQQARSHNMMKAAYALRPFREPYGFSGPKHLRRLYGKCFSLTDDSYLYQLCPFANITQHEQTWRWNAFKGILGIWKEWSIVENTFEAMVMTEGDQCPGGLRRQSKVFLKCAEKDKLLSVKEPRTCQYEVKFQTPLACPIDAFLVYPALSREQQDEWDEIKRSFYHEELTMQGYEKLRRKLFRSAGLLVPLEQKTIAVNAKETSHLKGTDSAVHSGFKTTEECSKAYSELRQKYDKLMQLHQRSNSTVQRLSNVSRTNTRSLEDVTRARGDHGTI